jgi:hypothetical protein
MSTTALMFLMFLGSEAAMPLPWTRILELTNPPMAGKDVVILQNLLERSPVVENQPTTGLFVE